MSKISINDLASIILDQSPTSPFSFTLRKSTNVDKSNQKDYLYKLEKFEQMGIKITNKVFEDNHTNKGIHCHGVMQVPKKFNMKRFRTRGWHIHLTELYDEAGWHAYMAKEQILDNDQVSDDIEPAFPTPKHKLF